MQKSFLITGAGSGIGEASAIKLSQEGHRIILCGRRKANLEEVKNKLEGNGHICLPVDVSNKMEVKDAYNSIGLESLNLAGLFANAGIGGENAYGDEDRWKKW